MASKGRGRRAKAAERNHVGTTLSNQALQELDAYCERLDRTRSWVMRQAIAAYLAKDGQKR